LSSASASASHNSAAAPDATMRLAMAKPMPRAPPVTMALRFFRSMVFMKALPLSRLSELHPIGAFEPERRTRFVRRGDLVAEILDDAADLGDLLGIAFGELARADIERVLKPDPHIAAEHRGRGAEIHLVPPAGQHGPQIIVAEQPVGGALHEEQIVEIGTDAAENAEDELQKHRRLEQAALDAM